MSRTDIVVAGILAGGKCFSCTSTARVAFIFNSPTATVCDLPPKYHKSEKRVKSIGWMNSRASELGMSIKFSRDCNAMHRVYYSFAFRLQFPACFRRRSTASGGALYSCRSVSTVVLLSVSVSPGPRNSFAPNRGANSESCGTCIQFWRPPRTIFIQFRPHWRFVSVTMTFQLLL
jgi:hypothetical protein